MTFHCLPWPSEAPHRAAVPAAPLPCPACPPLVRVPRRLCARHPAAAQLDLAMYKLLFEPHASLAFDIAVTADAAARVHLAVHGRFSLGCVPIADLPALQFGATPSLVAVRLASSLHSLTVVARTSAPSHAILPDGTRQEHPPGTLLLAFRTGQLTRARREIRALALSFMQVCPRPLSRAFSRLLRPQIWPHLLSPFHTPSLHPLSLTHFLSHFLYHFLSHFLSHNISHPLSPSLSPSLSPPRSPSLAPPLAHEVRGARDARQGGPAGGATAVDRGNLPAACQDGRALDRAAASTRPHDSFRAARRAARMRSALATAAGAPEGFRWLPMASDGFRRLPTASDELPRASGGFSDRHVPLSRPPDLLRQRAQGGGPLAYPQGACRRGQRPHAALRHTDPPRPRHAHPAPLTPRRPLQVALPLCRARSAGECRPSAFGSPSGRLRVAFGSSSEWPATCPPSASSSPPSCLRIAFFSSPQLPSDCLLLIAFHCCRLLLRSLHASRPPSTPPPPFAPPRSFSSSPYAALRPSSAASCAGSSARCARCATAIRPLMASECL